MRYDVLLWDIDGTLLDFLEAQKAALRTCFERFGMGKCTDAMISRYSEINVRYWQALERGEISKKEVLVGRFRDFFELEKLDSSKAELFNAQYQKRLGDTCVFRDHAYELVKGLKGIVLQCAVTNGTLEAQSRKLKNSGLGELLDELFISDLIGFEKPSIQFFTPVFQKLYQRNKGKKVPSDRILIVGDSLTSDVQGGKNAGIATCWYNPEHKENKTDILPDYVIDHLDQIKNIL